MRWFNLFNVAIVFMMLLFTACSHMEKKIKASREEETASSGQLNKLELITAEKQSLTVALLQLEYQVEQKKLLGSSIIIEGESLVYRNLDENKYAVLPEAIRLIRFALRKRLSTVILYKDNFQKVTLKKLLSRFETAKSKINFTPRKYLSDFSHIRPILILAHDYELLWSAESGTKLKSAWRPLWVKLPNRFRMDVAMSHWLRFL